MLEKLHKLKKENQNSLFFFKLIGDESAIVERYRVDTEGFVFYTTVDGFDYFCHVDEIEQATLVP